MLSWGNILATLPIYSSKPMLGNIDIHLLMCASVVACGSATFLDQQIMWLFWVAWSAVLVDLLLVHLAWPAPPALACYSWASGLPSLLRLDLVLHSILHLLSARIVWWNRGGFNDLAKELCVVQWGTRAVRAVSENSGVFPVCYGWLCSYPYPGEWNGCAVDSTSVCGDGAAWLVASQFLWTGASAGWAYPTCVNYFELPNGFTCDFAHDVVLRLVLAN